MKTRKGFISNSSTTSFVCDYCGHEAAGMDLNIRDACMYECENGHTYCQNHTEIDTEAAESLKRLLIESMENSVRKYENRAMNRNPTDRTTKETYLKWAKEEFERKTHLMALEDEELQQWLDEDGCDYVYELLYDMPANTCPLCSFKEIADSDLIAYFLGIRKETKEFITKEMASRFKSYDEFKTWCKGRST